MTRSDSRQGLLASKRPLRVIAWPAFSNRRENPYNSLLYSALQKQGVEVEEFSAGRLFHTRASIFHMHWAPTTRIRGTNRASVIAHAASVIGAATLAHLRGIRVVWTPHNLEAHDRVAHPDLEKPYWRALGKLLDGLISLSTAGIDLVRQRYPALSRVPAYVTPHGHYRDAYAPTTNRDDARTKLSIPRNAKVVAFVGQIRPYKNLPALVNAFSAASDPDAVLLLAGIMKLDKLARNELEKSVARDSRIRLVPRFITDEELPVLFGAADLIVLPFRDTLNSGVAILALSFDRPVLVPAMGSLTELSEELGSGWVSTYKGLLDAATLSAALAASMGKHGERAPLEHLEWVRVARMTLEAYLSILQG